MKPRDSIVLASVLLGLALLGSCRRATFPPEAAGFPRCAASDQEGNAVTCAAPPRTYDGERCVCANGKGLAYPGWVEEYPR